jgi:hypothetical protein
MMDGTLALIAFLSTTGLGRPWFFGIVALVGCIHAARHGMPRQMVVAVSCLSAFVLIDSVGLAFVEPLGDYAAIGGWGGPLPLACIAGLLSATVAGPKFRRIFVALVCLEVLVGFVEAYLGIRSVIPGSWEPTTMMGESPYLYGNRVFGLGTNSSTFAVRVLCALILLGLHWQEGIFRGRDYFAALLLVSSFAVNFSRAALMAAALSVAITLWHRSPRLFWGVTVCAAAGTAFFWKQVWEQLNRGQEWLDLSARDWIASTYLDFIAEHPTFGNFGVKYYVATQGEGAEPLIYHAHNSYLQVAATNGVPFLLLLLIIISFAPWHRIVIAFPLLAYSLLQYGIFWGASVYDQLFWAALFYPSAVGSHTSRPWHNPRPLPIRPPFQLQELR